MFQRNIPDSLYLICLNCNCTQFVNSSCIFIHIFSIVFTYATIRMNQFSSTIFGNLLFGFLFTFIFRGVFRVGW